MPNNNQSNSIVPILNGTDAADRVMVAEKGGLDGAIHARAIIADDYPNYKLIINGDPDDLTDTPNFEFYDIANDWDEQTPLGYDASQTYEINTALLDAMGGNLRAAYDACVAVDTLLGGGYSDLPVSP